MRYVFVCVLILLMCILWIRDRKKNSLRLIFTTFWTLIYFFSLFRLFGLYEISNSVYAYITFGIIFFVAGSDLIGVFYGYRIKKRVLLYTNGKLSKSFYIFLYIAALIALWKTLRMLPAVIYGGLSYARYQMSNNESVMLPGFWNILLGYFAIPYLRASITIFSVEMINTNITGKKLIKILIITTISFLADNAGRSSILYVFITFAYLLIKNKNKISRKTKKKLAYGIAIIIVFVVFSTIERKVDLLESTYAYYCGELVYFSKNLSNKYIFGTEYLYGVNSLQGILRPIWGVLNILGLEDPDYMVKANDFIMNVQFTTTYVSPNTRMNYFITCFGYFYKDGGVLGICIGSLLFGMLCGYVEKKNDIFPNSYLWICEKIILLQGILFTMSKFVLSDYRIVMSMLYIWLIFRNSKYDNTIQD